MTSKQEKQRTQALNELRRFIRLQGKALSTERAYCNAVGKFLDYTHPNPKRVPSPIERMELTA